VFIIAQQLGAVDEHVNNAGRILVRLFKGGVVLNLCQLEYHQVRKAIWLELAALLDFQILRRKSSKAADSLFEWNHLLIVDVFAEQPAEIAISPMKGLPPLPS
jgi:hypothetical protein